MANNNFSGNWWDNGNDLALIEAMLRHARTQDNGFSGETHSTMNSCLVGTARRLGMSEDDIQDAFNSDRGLVIYEP